MLIDKKNQVSKDWLDTLNPEQKDAVKTTEGPLLVLSGAGTGKTRVLTSRIAFILERNLSKPWEVLAVTFTNRAAKEMQQRVGKIVGPIAESIWIGTFHSIANRILRKHPKLVGLDNDFTILDQDDQLRLLKQLIEDDGYNLNNFTIIFEFFY